MKNLEEIHAARQLLFRYNSSHPQGIPAGSFVNSLFDTMEKADSWNRVKLVNAFPEFGPAVEILTTVGSTELGRRIEIAVRDLEHS